MKTLIISLGVILFILAGCGENKQTTEDLIFVDVTKSYPKREMLLHYFLDVEYISLETNDNFITSANIQAIGQKIMIFTNLRMDGDIFIFDRNGKALRKINRWGQGPEEYAFIKNVILDEDNGEMHVNDIFSSKIAVYDLVGNFKRSFRYKDGIGLDQIGNFDKDNWICHDSYYSYDKGTLINKKRNCFFLISKQDGSIQEIPIPYKEKKSMIVVGKDANGKTIGDRHIRNRELIPYRDNWILTESSADTIYSYSTEQYMKPFIVRIPSVQSMNPEIFLLPGVLTERYYFMQTIKKEFDFVSNTGLPRTELIYDKQENTIFESAVYNDDIANKIPISLVWEYPMFAFGNKEIAFTKRLEAYDLIEAYEKGQLKGKLKEIAANLNEESNAVIMLAKYKK